MRPASPVKKSTQGFTSADYIREGYWSAPSAPAKPVYSPPNFPYFPFFPYFPYFPPVPPYIPPYFPVSPGDQSIKIATRELFVNDNDITDPETMFQRTIGDVSGMELLELTRYNSVDGIDQTYSPITGLADMNLQYNPTNIISLQSTSDEYFKQFTIPLQRYVPNEGTGPGGEIVYLDEDPSSPTYNDLIINTINLKSTEKLEIEFISFDTSVNVKWYN